GVHLARPGLWLYCQLQVEARPRRDVPRLAGRPGAAVRVGRTLDEPDLLPGDATGRAQPEHGDDDRRIPTRPSAHLAPSGPGAASTRASALLPRMRDHLGLAAGPSGSLRRGSDRSRRYMIWLYS